MTFSSWTIIERQNRQTGARPDNTHEATHRDTGASLPSAFLTAPPVLRHDGIPPEVSLLLPNQDTNRLLIESLGRNGMPYRSAGIGFFLADPFLNVTQIINVLKHANVSWIANLPSVEQQDEAFTQQLTDIGLDREREYARLKTLREAGLHIATTITDPAAALRAQEIDTDAILILPRVSDFAAGFPSFRQRGAVAQLTRQHLNERGWTGPILGLGDASEAAHETLWPDALSGLICRPTECALD